MTHCDKFQKLFQKLFQFDAYDLDFGIYRILNFKQYKEFILNELKNRQPHIIHADGQSVLTTQFFGSSVEIKYIEPEFKKLMVKT